MERLRQVTGQFMFILTLKVCWDYFYEEHSSIKCFSTYVVKAEMFLFFDGSPALQCPYHTLDQEQQKGSSRSFWEKSNNKKINPLRTFHLPSSAMISLLVFLENWRWRWWWRRGRGNGNDSWRKSTSGRREKEKEKENNGCIWSWPGSKVAL